MQARTPRGWRPHPGAFAVFALATAVLTSCTTGANPIATAGPTAQAAATAVAPAVQATATSLAPTLQSLATQATGVTAPVQVTDVNVSGQDSTVTLRAVGNQPINLSNWSLQVGAARTQLPAGLDMQPGQSVRLHTAAGTSSQTDVYLAQGAQTVASELRPGAQIVLANPSGTPVSSFVVPNS